VFTGTAAFWCRILCCVVSCIWLHLHGSSSGFFAEGGLPRILAAGVFFWFFRKSKAESDAEGEAEACAPIAGDTKEVTCSSTTPCASYALRP